MGRYSPAHASLCSHGSQDEIRCLPAGGIGSEIVASSPRWDAARHFVATQVQSGQGGGEDRGRGEPL